jgi:hypothetical protein
VARSNHITIRDERRRTDRSDVRSNDLLDGSLSFRFNVTTRDFTRNHDRSATRTSEGGHG